MMSSAGEKRADRWTTMVGKEHPSGLRRGQAGLRLGQVGGRWNAIAYTVIQIVCSVSKRQNCSRRISGAGLPLAELCTVADRLYTDIALGAAGLPTVLVLSGESRLEDVPAAPYPPTHGLAHLGALAEALRLAPT